MLIMTAIKANIIRKDAIGELLLLRPLQLNLYAQGSFQIAMVAHHSIRMM